MLKGTLLSVILIAASFAQAEVTPVYGDLTLSLTNIPSALTFEEADQVSVMVLKNSKTIGIQAALAAESDAALNDYKSAWELRAFSHPGNFVELKMISRGGTARSSCQQVILKGAYQRLKGVCLSRVTVYLPEGLRAQLQTDKKTLIFQNGSEPAAPIVGRLVSNDLISVLMTNLKEASFSSDKEKALNHFAQQELVSKQQHISTAQVISLLEPESFDDDKLRILQALKPYIFDIANNYPAVIECFTFASGKAGARRMLLGN